MSNLDENITLIGKIIGILVIFFGPISYMVRVGAVQAEHNRRLLKLEGEENVEERDCIGIRADCARFHNEKFSHYEDGLVRLEGYVSNLQQEVRKQSMQSDRILTAIERLAEKEKK